MFFYLQMDDFFERKIHHVIYNTPPTRQIAQPEKPYEFKCEFTSTNQSRDPKAGPAF
jgi:hypothetical protein